MNNGQAMTLAWPAPFQDWQNIFTQPSWNSCLNYIKALCSEMRSFSVLGFTDLLNLSYDKHDHFISRAVWNERQFNRYRVAADIRHLGKKKLNVILDDSSTRKFTNNPYFVGRGYIGNLGKVDRCLSGVFTCFTDGDEVFPVEVDLYLPASKLTAGKQDHEFRSKIEIALSLLNRASFLAQELEIDVLYYIFDMWYASNRIFNLLHEGGVHYFTEIRPNRVLVQGKERISLKSFVTAHMLNPVFVDYREKEYKIWSAVARLDGVTHPVKIFMARFKVKGKEETHFWVTNDLTLTEEGAVELHCMRWRIDYFFREAKAYLALDEGKFQKMRCYLRHFYLTFAGWSAIRMLIRLKCLQRLDKRKHLKTVQTTFQVVRLIRKKQNE